ncbi:hypothetical protein [Yersinia kristensenii]|uniref:hypothetical protein n=1 Tax=Yersinia kristensenii TaxID=28152 RepID=UPI00268582F6
MLPFYGALLLVLMLVIIFRQYRCGCQESLVFTPAKHQLAIYHKYVGPLTGPTYRNTSKSIP